MHWRALNKIILISAPLSFSSRPALIVYHLRPYTQQESLPPARNNFRCDAIFFILTFPFLVAQHHSRTTLTTPSTYHTTKIFLHDIRSLAPSTVALLAVFSFSLALLSLFCLRCIPRLFRPSNHDPKSYNLRRNTTTGRTAFLSTVHLHSANPPALHTGSRRRSKVSVWR